MENNNNGLVEFDIAAITAAAKARIAAKKAAFDTDAARVEAKVAETEQLLKG